LFAFFVQDDIKKIPTDTSVPTEADPDTPEEEDLVFGVATTMPSEPKTAASAPTTAVDAIPDDIETEPSAADEDMSYDGDDNESSNSMIKFYALFVIVFLVVPLALCSKFGGLQWLWRITDRKGKYRMVNNHDKDLEG